MNYNDYFEFRQVKPEDYASCELPAYLAPVVAGRENPRILDFGCGFGQLLQALCNAGVAAEGLDIEPAAIEFCRSRGLTCTNALECPEFFPRNAGQFDFVVMSHVLEHFPKEEIIPRLKEVKGLLKPGGALIVMVPNAQSHTGAYWAYEDFTHQCLFTSGSLYFVLRSAGYRNIDFLDIDCTAGLPGWKKVAKRILIGLYEAKLNFWNRVTTSYFHRPSLPIYSYEIKALAHA